MGQCGHNPKHLRPYERDPKKDDPPPIIVEIQKRIKDFAGRPRACPQIFCHTPEDDAAGKPRQERSEGRERDAAYLCSMIDHMDEVTLRVGVPQAGGKLHRYSVEELAKGTGMEVAEEAEAESEGKKKKRKQPGRFHRAASRMDEMGFVMTKRRSGKGHGPVNLYSSRVVSLKLLCAIGMEKAFSRARSLESQRRVNGGATNEERSEALGNAVPPAEEPRCYDRGEGIENFFDELKRTHKVPRPP